MKLSKLIERITNTEVYGDVNVEISGISDNSKDVRKDGLFVAIKGLRVDSHDFIDEAIKLGAKAIIGENEPQSSWLDKVTYVKVINSRDALSIVACAWYDYPADKLKIIGVTGTDGKTTTTNIIYHLLSRNNRRVGIISTINAKIAGRDVDTGLHVTNPEPLMLQQLLSEMVKAELEFVVLEVTSHGLDQGRVEGINFDVGVITNVTHEHLDYHKTWENYFKSKMKLLDKSKVIVINRDDVSYKKISKMFVDKETISYSAVGNESDLFILNTSVEQSGQRYKLSYKGQNYSSKTNLKGLYNLSNILAAVGATISTGVDIGNILRFTNNIPNLSGRYEVIPNNRGIRIIVDFAHTPNSLENLLSDLKKSTVGKLVVIFGCAGERDKEKRKLMPKIATKLTDLSVFTAEDPRSEDVNDILSQMEKSVDKNIRDKYVCVPERGQAIYDAINIYAKPNDTIVICGKGHERSMAYNGVEYPWSDQDAVLDALSGKVKEIIR